MIEPIMYLAIGFLVSMLFGLMIVPLVHNRAVRLTTRRLEAATPLSMAEIQADKDQLRAEFAMSARRLEMSVDQLKNKTTSQLAELGKKIRRHQPHEDRARRKERHDLLARSAREGDEGTAARHRRGIRRQDRGAAQRREGADRQAGRTRQNQSPNCPTVR